MKSGLGPYLTDPDRPSYSDDEIKDAIRRKVMAKARKKLKR